MAGGLVGAVHARSVCRIRGAVRQARLSRTVTTRPDTTVRRRSLRDEYALLNAGNNLVSQPNLRLLLCRAYSDARRFRYGTRWVLDREYTGATSRCPLRRIVRP